MQVTARIKNLRIPPKKVRLITNFVKGKSVDVALDQLRFMNKQTAAPVADLIRSAVANAVHNFKLDKDNLMIKDCQANLGLTLRRYMPKAHGRATLLQKKMSHVTITLAEIKPSKEHDGVKPKKANVDTTDARENIHETDEVKGKISKGKKVSKNAGDEKGVEVVSPARQASRVENVKKETKKSAKKSA